MMASRKKTAPPQTEVAAADKPPEVTPTAPEARTVAPGGPVLMVRVTGPRRGRWRAGRHFGPEPVEFPAADLTEDEGAALLADPALTVETFETAAPSADA